MIALITIGVIVWFACGLIAWCGCIAYFSRAYPEVWRRESEELGAFYLAAYLFAIGPFGLFVTTVMSHRFKHGLRLWA